MSQVSDFIKPKTVDIKYLVEDKVMEFIKKLKSKEEVEGIVLLGGLGKRQFLDEFSDIDLAIFIDAERISKWMPPFEFKIFEQGKELLFNVHQQNIRNEKKADWDESKKQVYSDGIIIFDRNGKVKTLLKKKLSFMGGSTIRVLKGILFSTASFDNFSRVLITKERIIGISTPVSQYIAVTGFDFP